MIRLANTDLFLKNDLLAIPLPLAYKYKGYVEEALKQQKYEQ